MKNNTKPNNKPYFKSIKIVNRYIILTIYKNFFHEKKINIKNPLDKHTKFELQKFLKLNQHTKKLDLKTNICAEAIKTTSTTYDIFFSKIKKEPLKHINKLKNKNNNDIAIVAKFTNLKTLKFFCKNIFQTYKPFWLKSELYKFNKSNFILILHTKKETEDDLSALLTEFSATIEKGKFQEAIIKEHCKVIFINNAIEKTSLTN